MRVVFYGKPSIAPNWQIHATAKFSVDTSQSYKDLSRFGNKILQRTVSAIIHVIKTFIYGKSAFWRERNTTAKAKLFRILLKRAPWDQLSELQALRIGVLADLSTPLFEAIFYPSDTLVFHVNSIEIEFLYMIEGNRILVFNLETQREFEFGRLSSKCIKLAADPGMLIDISA